MANQKPKPSARKPWPKGDGRHMPNPNPGQGAIPKGGALQPKGNPDFRP